jgi:hypothetical protein
MMTRHRSDWWVDPNLGLEAWTIWLDESRRASEARSGYVWGMDEPKEKDASPVQEGG